MNPEPTIFAYARAFSRSNALYRNPGTMRTEQELAGALPKSNAPQCRRVVLVQENRICLDNNRNSVGIIVDKDLKDKVVNVNRISDKLLLIKLVLGAEIINVSSIYAPQVGLKDRITRQFWEDKDGIAIPDFAMAYKLAIANTYIKKRDEHLITYKSKSHKSQIDVFLFKVDQPSCKDWKVIPAESLSTKHGLMVIDADLEGKKFR
ncbi:hypothetical protein AMTRI_Chr13g117050 [Amborella trichopoda]